MFRKISPPHPFYVPAFSIETSTIFSSRHIGPILTTRSINVGNKRGTLINLTVMAPKLYDFHQKFCPGTQSEVESLKDVDGCIQMNKVSPSLFSFYYNFKKARIIEVTYLYLISLSLFTYCENISP